MKLWEVTHLSFLHIVRKSVLLISKIRSITYWRSVVYRRIMTVVFLWSFPKTVIDLTFAWSLVQETPRPKLMATCVLLRWSYWLYVLIKKFEFLFIFSYRSVNTHNLLLSSYFHMYEWLNLFLTTRKYIFVSRISKKILSTFLLIDKMVHNKNITVIYMIDWPSLPSSPPVLSYTLTCEFSSL